MKGSIQQYIQIARPDHWVKNIFMVPGLAMALIFEKSWGEGTISKMFIGLISCCLISSANYVLNEFVDAASDRHHPLKKNRPGAKDELNAFVVLIEYISLALLGFLLAWNINKPFLCTSIFFLLMGIIYNLRPIRTKDIPYLDVLSESINSVIRFLLGWFIIDSILLPPSSILLAYYFGGAFLMNTKRYAEYRIINNHANACLYRKSFKYYTEKKLLLISFFYALLTSFFMAIFLIKYRIELVLSFPFFAILFTWYFSISMKPNSAAQAPEKLFSERAFISFAFLTFGVVVTLCFINIPILNVLMHPSNIRLS